MPLVYVSRVFNLFLISPTFIITETTIPPRACSQANLPLSWEPAQAKCAWMYVRIRPSVIIIPSRIARLSGFFLTKLLSTYGINFSNISITAGKSLFCLRVSSAAWPAWIAFSRVKSGFLSNLSWSLRSLMPQIKMSLISESAMEPNSQSLALCLSSVT